MIDYSAGEISTAEAADLIACLDAAFHADDCTLYAGISYRHCLVLRGTQTGSDCTPPHDLSGQPVRGHLPSGRHGARLREMMERSRALLRDHPVNQARIARGLRPANACWFWGEGTRPALCLLYTSFDQVAALRVHMDGNVGRAHLELLLVDDVARRQIRIGAERVVIPRVKRFYVFLGNAAGL